MSRKRTKSAANAGGVAGEPAASFHTLTKSALSVLLKRSNSSVKPTVQIVGVHRFLLDETFQDVTGVGSSMAAASSEVDSPPGSPGGTSKHARPTPKQYRYGHDIVVAAGRERLRCVLSTSLNPLVEKGEIRAMSYVQVEDWMYPRFVTQILAAA